MADCTIGSLSKAESLDDEALLLMEQQGEAMSLTGAQLRSFAEQAAANAKAGATFVPSVSADGVLSWTNNGGLPNPDPINLIGPSGAANNPNLLDNWFFANPVNQRGATEYSGPGYTIDRWKIDSETTLTIADGGISAVDLHQIVCDQNILAGKTITLSVLFTSGVFGSASAVMTSDVTTSAVKVLTVSLSERIGNGIYSYGKAHLSAENGKVKVSFDTIIGTICAAKLELGSVQTLAHKNASGEWELNEIPNYGEQLARCQRYQTAIGANTTARASLVTANAIRFLIPVPAEMRGTPAISGTFAIRNMSGGTEDGFTFAAVNRKVGIEIQATKTAHGLTDACLLVSTAVLLDANL